MIMVRPNDYGAILDDDDDDDLARLNAIGGRYKVGPWRHICGTLIVHSLASEEASFYLVVSYLASLVNKLGLEGKPHLQSGDGFRKLAQQLHKQV